MKKNKQMVTCPICRARPADSREHVWAHWYLESMDKHAAPMTAWTSNGTPVVNRDGVQYAGRAERERVMLDICQTCNNELDRRFEKPAQGLVDTLVKAGFAGALTQEQWGAVGLWWAKLLLLLGLPESRYATPRINDKIVARFDAADQLDLRWLTDGSPVPDGLSLYAYRVDLDDTSIHHTVPIPSVVTDATGNRTYFHFLHFATQGVGFSLVSHPGWPVEHPLVTSGSAWELLHSPPPSDSDLSLLPVFGPRAIWWPTFGAVLKPEFALDNTLPPLRATGGVIDPDPRVLEVLEGYEF